MRLFKRYLLNVNSLEIHDLRNTKANCLLPMMNNSNKVYLTRKQALTMLNSEIIDGCKYCNNKYHNH
jgi:hypothetical protein